MDNELLADAACDSLFAAASESDSDASCDNDALAETTADWEATSEAAALALADASSDAEAEAVSDALWLLLCTIDSESDPFSELTILFDSTAE